MTDSPEILELERQIARDKLKYSELERLNAALLENIPAKGFTAAHTEIKYRGEMEELANSIRVGEEKLAGVRSQLNKGA